MTVGIGCKKCGIIPCNCEERKKAVPFSGGLGGEPLRIECGQGKIGVYDGDLDGVPCLTLCNDGTGVIGEPNGRKLPGAIPQEDELVTVTFTKTESVDVFIRALERMRKRL